MSKLTEFFNGLMALIGACLIVGIILAVTVFGGVFLTVAGIIVGSGIVILLIVAGIYEWLTTPSGQ